jgi:hypothetical protein
MDEMIGYCGYNCSLCAARSDDPALRQRLVDGWRTYLGHEHYTVDNVLCDGCRADGRLADKACQARPCARAKGLESCALCDKFPCDKVSGLLCSREGLMIFVNKRLATISEDEYNLCLRQFESMPNLVRTLVDAGKLPAWMAEDSPEH